MNIELQRQLLGDPIRNQTFLKAIRKQVKPGDTVIDLGAGTGYLGLMALKAGAKKVIFIEEDPILSVAVEMAKAMGLYDQCAFYEFHSKDLNLDLQADVLLCETLGTYAFEEHLIENWLDAKRFTHHQTRWIPHQITLQARYVTDQKCHQEVDVWPSIEGTFPWETLRKTALSRSYARVIPEKACSKEQQKIITLSHTSSDLNSQWQRSITWTCPKGTDVYGMCLYWEADLGSEIHLSTAPNSPLTHWKQLYLPFLEPLQANKHDQLKFTFTSDTHWETGMALTWQGLLEINGHVKQEINMSTQDGYPFMIE